MNINLNRYWIAGSSALLTVGINAAQLSPSPWLERSLSGIDPPKIVESDQNPSKDAKVISDPALQALALLDDNSFFESNTNWNQNLPEVPTLATVSNAVVLLNEEDMDSSIEPIKLNDLLREVDEIRKTQGPLAVVELLEEAKEGFKQDDSLHRLNEYIGIQYHRLQNYPKALDALVQANRLKPTSASTACNLAAIQLYMGLLDEAIDVLGRIPLELGSNKNMQFSTHFNFACAYSLKNEKEKAITHLETAVRADPQSTFTSLSDAMLDNIRELDGFVRIQDLLQTHLMHRR